MLGWLAEAPEGGGGGGSAQQKTEATHFTMDSKTIVFTDFLFAGKTLPFLGLNQ
ncbi:unnamed protein product [Prunus armeniaca]